MGTRVSKHKIVGLCVSQRLGMVLVMPQGALVEIGDQARTWEYEYNYGARRSHNMRLKVRNEATCIHGYICISKFVYCYKLG